MAVDLNVRRVRRGQSSLEGVEPLPWTAPTAFPISTDRSRIPATIRVF